jgi:hypothetical protein
VVGEPEAVLPAIAAAPQWNEASRNFAVVR